MKIISDKSLTAEDIHEEINTLKKALESFKFEILNKLKEEKPGMFGSIFGRK